ncbi:uncharacterized protein [Clytia hemisphaerica]|uniref:MARVEL domain-containing protein n=1 Tax=Clytia hemisphaerica TaxID=252671 RepID=A0A7M5WSA5_9CNID
MGLDTNYVKSYFGILKIIEFFFLLIAWACMVDYYNGNLSYLSSKNSFFVAMNIMAWVFVIIWFFGYLLSQCHLVNISNKMVVYGIIHLIWFALLLISGALCAQLAADTRKACDYLSRFNKYYTCNIAKYEAAVAFGIISSVVFLVDGILHIQQRNSVMASSSSGGVVTKRTVVTTTTTTKK